MKFISLLFLAFVSLQCSAERNKSSEISVGKQDNNGGSSGATIDCSSYLVENDKTPFPLHLESKMSDHANTQYDCRRKQVLSSFLKMYSGSEPSNDKKDNRNSFRRFATWASSALLLSDEMEVGKVSKVLESSIANAWNYGSSFDLPIKLPGAVCSRVGDYDFVAYQIAQLALLSEKNKEFHKPHLSDAAIEKIKELLPLQGAPSNHIPDLKDVNVGSQPEAEAPLDGHGTNFTLSCELPASFSGVLRGRVNLVPETENHVLMTNIAKYFTNQLLKNENKKNGYDRWMNRHLESFLTNYFDEYNSRPYQEYAIAPILALANLADDERVRQSAMKVVQQINATLAIQSRGLRRFSPFRRQPKYKNNVLSEKGDGILAMPAYFSGYYPKIDKNKLANFGHSVLLSAVLFDVQPLGPVVLSLLTEEEEMSYEQRFSYAGNEEHYSATPSFLMSSSGRMHKYENCPEKSILNLENNVYLGLAKAMDLGGCLAPDQMGWALSTVLVATKQHSSNLTDMLRFSGHWDVKKRNSNCVGNGVACGLNPKIPAWMMKQCPVVEEQGWTFINLNDESKGDCYLGFYAGMRTQECSADAGCSGIRSFGVLDAFHVEDGSLISFDTYQAELKNNNRQALELNAEQIFINSRGVPMKLFISSGYETGSYIRRGDAESPAAGFKAVGDVLNTGEKKLTISSPSLVDQELVLESQ